MTLETETMDVNSILKPIIGPWYESLKDPLQAQEQTLNDLLKKYGETDYGKVHNATSICSVKEYQKNFPIMNYYGYLPYFSKVKEGDYKALLSEPPECWVMTRGSTGKSKVLPATQTHLNHREEDS